ncbi:MAG TPA: lysyl oxidase family protein, partial [Myxococcota bacterium]|nr:lysyl oxidase family protein [Myxococcota bacterium]
DVVEGCASDTIARDLLRLTLITHNDGAAPLDLGDPNCPDCATHPEQVCGNPDFICSPAGGHDHPHYRDFLRYELVQDPNGPAVAAGGKRSFCLAESMCLDGFPPNRHTCTNQGIGAGCWDTYDYFLGCQYVDVTDLADGDYFLRVTVDPLGQIAESNEDDNVLVQPVTIARAPLADAPLAGLGLALRPKHQLQLRASSRAPIDLGGTDGDPTRSGATLYVRDTVLGDEVAFGLPAGGWTRIGRADHPRGFRYRGAGTDDDACLSVEVSRTALRLRCSLAGEHGHFVTPVQGDVAVRLLLGAGERRFCTSFGGRTLRNDAITVKRRSAPPTLCDAPG